MGSRALRRIGSACPDVRGGARRGEQRRSATAWLHPDVHLRDGIGGVPIHRLRPPVVSPVPPGAAGRHDAWVSDDGRAADARQPLQPGRQARRDRDAVSRRQPGRGSAARAAEELLGHLQPGELAPGFRGRGCARGNDTGRDGALADRPMLLRSGLARRGGRRPERQGEQSQCDAARGSPWAARIKAGQSERAEYCLWSKPRGSSCPPPGSLRATPLPSAT
jgi:hypothetical protein